jgi:proteasome lid subunit RPN8/RPN11
MFALAVSFREIHTLKLVHKVEKTVAIQRAVTDSILSYANTLHPKEAILLLNGRIDKNRILVSDTQIPPLAIHAETYSSFPLHMLPLDLSIIGTMHSHPSGTFYPSTTDMNKFYGKIMIIVAYPYESEEDFAVFNREGKRLKYEVI